MGNIPKITMITKQTVTKKSKPQQGGLMQCQLSREHYVSTNLCLGILCQMPFRMRWPFRMWMESLIILRTVRVFLIRRKWEKNVYKFECRYCWMAMKLIVLATKWRIISKITLSFTNIFMSLFMHCRYHGSVCTKFKQKKDSRVRWYSILCKCFYVHKPKFIMF